MDQLAVHFVPKSASMTGQLHLPEPLFLQQQVLPQSNIAHETQLPITHPLDNLPLPPNQPIRESATLSPATAIS